MNIYVASSWRNKRQPQIVKVLRKAGHEVYDFRNPHESYYGFQWEWIDKDWKSWTMEEFRERLNHPIAENGFNLDWNAMKWADACVLVMPCGRSAHLEAGYFIGADKILIILLSDGEPELMYKMSNRICISENEVIKALDD